MRHKMHSTGVISGIQVLPMNCLICCLDTAGRRAFISNSLYRCIRLLIEAYARLFDGTLPKKAGLSPLGKQSEKEKDTRRTEEEVNWQRVERDAWAHVQAIFEELEPDRESPTRSKVIYATSYSS